MTCVRLVAEEWGKGGQGGQQDSSDVELGLCKGSVSPLFLWSLQWRAGLGSSTAGQGQGK